MIGDEEVGRGATMGRRKEEEGKYMSKTRRAV